MKKVMIILVLAMTFIGCRPYSYVIEELDYTPLTTRGFFVTESNSVGFDYNAVSNFAFKMESGYADKQEMKDGKLIESENVNQFSLGYQGWKHIYFNDFLNNFYDEATRRGANGILNIRITKLHGKKRINKTFDTFVLTGLLIDKK